MGHPLDVQRAEWFNESCRFGHWDDLTDRKTIWSSWSTWCSSRDLDCGSKTGLWKWLQQIGIVQYELCSWAFRRMKMR